jgi:hypothetical protein
MKTLKRGTKKMRFKIVYLFFIGRSVLIIGHRFRRFDVTKVTGILISSQVVTAKKNTFFLIVFVIN